MQPRHFQLEDGSRLLVREVVVNDTRSILDYVGRISHESDFLSFGPGEFDLSESDEEEFICTSQAAENQLFILGTRQNEIVSSLSFTGGRFQRVRHTGEFGLSVLRDYWGLGIGSAMLDTLIEWAKSTRIVVKINLRVRTDNGRAIALYERRGFAIEGTILKEIQVDGRYFDHHCMGLSIDFDF